MPSMQASAATVELVLMGSPNRSCKAVPPTDGALLRRS